MWEKTMTKMWWLGELGVDASSLGSIAGRQVLTGDFHVLAADHAHDLESSSEALVCRVPHYAAAADPNMEVLRP
jgi:hypothetical protein